MGVDRRCTRVSNIRVVFRFFRTEDLISSFRNYCSKEHGKCRAGHFCVKSCLLAALLATLPAGYVELVVACSVTFIFIQRSRSRHGLALQLPFECSSNG
jgi:hypothetical protein